MIRVMPIPINKLKEAEEFIQDNCYKKISLTNKVVLAMMEHEEIIGISVLYLNKGQAYLETLVVLSTRRGECLGDSLLRASLNYVLQRGFKDCVYDKEEGREFFIKSGFMPIKEEKENKEELCGGLVIDIESFFSKNCISKG